MKNFMEPLYSGIGLINERNNNPDGVIEGFISSMNKIRRIARIARNDIFITFRAKFTHLSINISTPAGFV